MQFAEIAVDFPDDRARTFTYSVPEGLSVTPGDLVWVPFGAQLLQGVVFSLHDNAPEQEARPIVSVVNDGPFISGPRLRVAEWVARYYRTTLFIACSLTLPPGARTKLRTWVKLSAKAAQLSLDPDTPLRAHEERVIKGLANGEWGRKDRIARSLGRGGTVTVDRLLRRGMLTIRHEWERPRAHAVFRDVVKLSAAPEETARLRSEFAGGRFEKRADLLAYLQRQPEAETRAQLAKKFGMGAVKWALQSGAAALESMRVERDPLADYVVQQQFPLDPTPDQQDAISAITRSIDGADGLPGRFLLYGITGSGKTEVYLQAADHCLRRGKRVLVLVPEIALTPQTLQRFASRFPGKVALLHSGLSDGERFDQWWSVQEGHYPVVLGSRGAVFAPIGNLGLIVMDEEHEWTYKQHDQTPRYHARDVAERLAIETGATLVLGSATPSVISFRRAERGDLQLLRLPERPPQITGFTNGTASGGRARVRVVDMREELRAGHTDILSRDLLDSMRRSLDGGGKIILYLNRRGFAAFIQCTVCGLMRHCRRCDNTVTYHSRGPDAPARLECHFCGYRVRATTACPACGGKSVRRTGPGTERVAEVVKAYFPRAGVLQWDSDTARTFKDHAALLKKFAEGSARVLVGTQMVAKGLDIPSVTLVGAVTADIGLGVPDFLAAERSFQVLAQVAGRAGRGPYGGEVVVQTMQPHHYAIEAAAAQDYEWFYEREMELRARHDMPPYSRLVRLLYSGPDATEAHATAYETAQRFERRKKVSGLSDVQVIGPAPAFPFRVRDMFRWHIALKGAAPERMLDEEPVGQGWAVDIDPVALT
jgi:primosomal protein N' (replication factor Y)